ncbi:ATP-dependent RecD-like DNA helicase [Catenulispora sp. NF23]|uniref:ATP-dependent RecD2 DNA helicase n=1 Tax=Catenulispora pinistramenti TaxID=2705254 RepID=A0ABS5KMT9_9ACTN|nr:ATP-dependent RecD-like DNA helicase [Catenulispora pinistramenti]MBS2531394.1 ATP-dependent RecD-like DNA helicase [Catenulispora pinistramenti]MBS2547326.1 ATP-dependent RecD-like DNA helicase [Catenulispora pinistramenti]
MEPTEQETLTTQLTPTEQLIQFECAVEHLIHVRPDEYTVARVVSEEVGEFTAAGAALAGVQPGSVVQLSGRWVRHHRYGDQFVAASCECVLPSHVRGIRMYLGSGLIRGIGPKLAAAIVEQFGEETLKVIDADPNRLLEVHGIGAGRRDKIAASWIGQKVVRDLMVVLQGFGISPLLATKVYIEFGAESLAVVRTDPYRLIEKVRGIGFAAADKIALASGIPAESPQRLRAALLDRLEAARGEGHCYVLRARLLLAARRLVGQEHDLLASALETLVAARAVVIEPDPREPDSDEPVVFSRTLHSTERSLASFLARLLAADSDLPPAVRKRAEASGGADPHAANLHAADPHADSHADQRADDLHADQRAAVAMALTSTVSVLTGGPGCGKSHTVKAIAAAVRSGGGRVTLAAPTGKAARRLAELTGMRAMTVHRLVADLPEADPDALFDDGPMMADLIVVDEASMLDVFLARRLVKLTVPGTHLLLVGDVDQLPSVGPGAVLRDILAVPGVARTELTHVFRQETGSTITANAHQIRRGRMPEDRDLHSHDFWFVDCDDPAEVAAQVVELACAKIPAKQGVPAADVQVLAPTRRGYCGTVALGRAIQERLNPAAEDKAEYWSGTSVFRVGDRVMPIRNNPDKGSAGVFNGTVAVIRGIDPQGRLVTLHTDDGDIAVYDFDELDQLLHSYAISIHRSQGSEYPYVVAPLVTEAGALMLHRNLLYTMVTRAKKTIVVVGQRRALEIAVHNAGRARDTALALRLETALEASETSFR